MNKNIFSSCCMNGKAIFGIFLLFLTSACEQFKLNKMTENDSYWSKTYTMSENENLKNNLDIDIAIIGGGYTGLSAAYHLARMNPDLDIAVFEAKTLGSGASGRNGGMLLTTLVDDYEDEEVLKWTYDLSVANIKFIDSLSEVYEIDIDLKNFGYCEAIHEENLLTEYQEYIKEAQAAGIPLKFLNKEETAEKLGSDNYQGGMFDPNGGSVHALKLVNLLKTAAEDEGVRIYENSPVVQLNEGKTHILKVASGGQNFEVKCSDVVVATNAYTSKLGIFKRQIMPVHTQCAATYPLTQAQKDAIGWEKKLPFFDSRVMLYHLVFTEDNRIVIGGGNVNYYFNNGLEYQGNLARVSDMMLEELIHLYPELKGLQFEYVWNGILGTSYDEVETVGVTGEHENIYYGLAYNGHGVNQSILFGNVIAHLYAEEYHAWEDTQFYGKTLSKVPVEPFRYMGANLFFKYWRWKDKRR